MSGFRGVVKYFAEKSIVFTILLVYNGNEGAMRGLHENDGF